MENSKENTSLDSSGADSEQGSAFMPVGRVGSGEINQPNDGVLVPTSALSDNPDFLYELNRHLKNSRGSILNEYLLSQRSN